MKAAPYLRFSVIGVVMLGAGSVLADELPLPGNPAQQREKMRSMSAEDRSVSREQMQERLRNMTPQEQKRMRETRTEGSAKGGGYGQGYESRRGEDNVSGGGRSISGGRGR
ncbi:MAG: hypothetical protein A3H35_21635 [Betaproteobacteria bacterium RIFCSPLOWO2_02_FULL_62_17]|nr:MAG: hypothetical protein A3H35_21635 [Betaproteobacteria bacterium RIFCSPLOWO2_02_FULL_62_17]